MIIKSFSKALILSLTLVATASFAGAYQGSHQYALNTITPIHAGTKQFCDKQLRQYLSAPVKTTYRINTDTLMEYATTNFNAKKEQLNALGISGRYMLGKWGINLHNAEHLYGVVYDMPFKAGTDIPDADHAKVNFIFTFPGYQDCELSN